MQKSNQEIVNEWLAKQEGRPGSNGKRKRRRPPPEVRRAWNALDAEKKRQSEPAHVGDAEGIKDGAKR